MINEYKYLHLNPRDKQIKILEGDFSSLKPHIKEAFDHIVGMREKLEENDHVDKIVERIISLATEFVRIKKSEDINFEPPEESIINSKELIKKILPLIKELRKELFGKEDPLFPINKLRNNWHKAIEWLKNEENRQHGHQTVSAEECDDSCHHDFRELGVFNDLARLDSE